MKISEATFNELKETFDRAIQEAFGAGVKEGREGVTTSVDEPATIEHEGLLLHKVERKSQTGDFVKYFGPKFDEYTQVGKLYEVFDTDQYLDDRGTEMGVYDWLHTEPELEIFEVVVDEIPLQDDPTEELVPIKSPNQQRYETNQRARDFVEELRRPGEEYSRSWEFREQPYINSEYGLSQGWKGTGNAYNAEFIVNKNKGTVVVLLRGYTRGKVLKRGIAKCAPGDVFNADIGKAIALARALEIDIPRVFLDAVQPTHYAVGQVITFPKDDVDFMKKTYRVDTVDSNDSELTMLFDDGRKAHGGNLTGSQFDTHEHRNTLPIIDDTNAEYNA